MKKFLSVFISILLLSSLAACGGETNTVKDFAVEDAGTLLESGAFTESLTGIDTEVACALYGIDETTVTGCAAYGATATSAEELAIFTFDSEDSAQAALKQLGYRIEDRTEELRDYLPDELPKLEGAVTQQRGASVLLLIAQDSQGWEKLLED